MMERIEDLFFYNLDKTIKTHRQFSQHRLKNHGYPITVDQWLLLTAVSQNKNITQIELAEMVFKDDASINRMVELLTQRDLIKKENNKQDKRKLSLLLTAKGKKLLKESYPVILKTRALALEDIAAEDLKIVRKVLAQIMHNCRPADRGE